MNRNGPSQQELEKRSADWVDSVAVEYLMCKHENLSLILKAQVKKACNPSAKETDTDGSDPRSLLAR